MIGGCLRNMMALAGCATLLVVGGVLGWHYRAQVAGVWRSFLDGRDAPATLAPDSVIGRPSEAALASAFEKTGEMARRDGPGVIVLTADEMVSLIHWGLGPLARGALDSMAVELREDRFALQAQLDTRIFTDELLGPLAGALQGREPVRLAGPARMAGTGVVAWEPDEIVIRAFPFPAAAVPRLVNALTMGSDGIIPIAVPPTVGEIRIRPAGVTFYRRIN